MQFPDEKLIETLRCPQCGGSLQLAKHESTQSFRCAECNLSFPFINGVPRTLLPSMRAAIANESSASSFDNKQAETARSFGYEWTSFPEMYSEWEQTFNAYMQPHEREFFRGKKVLDAGCGSGRFAYYAAKYGAEVWAVDLGQAVEVAASNTRDLNVQVIQADLHDLPFAPETFDFIYSLGVLHHLPDPENAFQNLLKYLKLGGEVQIYLYWKPEGQPIKGVLLGIITAIRGVTRQLPHSVIHFLAYPAALAAFAAFVLPYKLLKSIPPLRGVAEKVPMKQYASLPFRVCVNDQLDRFSAPIEHRYTRQEVIQWLQRALLNRPQVNAAYGWVATGVKAG